MITHTYKSSLVFGVFQKLFRDMELSDMKPKPLTLSLPLLEILPIFSS